MRIRSLFAALTLACFAPLAGAQTYGSPQANLTSPSTMSFNGIALSTKLPDARQYTGYTVYTSDQGLMLSNGTAWVAVGNGGGASPTSIAPYSFLANQTNSTATATAVPNRTLYVTAFGATGNTKSYPAGTMTVGSTVLTNTSATFTAADVGKQIVVDYAGPGGGPLITTINKFTSATSIVLSATASVAVPYYFQTAANVDTGGSGCVPGDTINASGGTSTTTATLKVSHCEVESATVNNAGTGGLSDLNTTSGTCVVYGTTGSGGVKFSVTVTLTSGAITSVSAFGTGTVQGQYSTNPTNTAAEPVTGCTGLTGATLNLVMGVKNLQPLTLGVYSVKPTNPVSQGAASGSEAGVTWDAIFPQAGVTTYGTDDTAAFNAAIAQENALWKAGTDACIFVPAGNYWISSALTMFRQTAPIVNGGGVPGCVKGEDRARARIYISPAMSGDLFSWSRAFPFNNKSHNGASEAFSQAVQGPRVSDLTINGDRTSSNIQHVFQFYDETLGIDLHRVEGFFIPGSFIRSGYTLNSPNAYLAESSFADLRCEWCGVTGYPVIDINKSGTTAVPNELHWDTINIFANYDVAFYLHTGQSYMKKLRIEGQQWDSANVRKPLLQLGDPAFLVPVTSFSCLDCELIDPYIDAAALLVTGGAGSAAPYGIYFEGEILGGVPVGRGLQIDYGRNNEFHFRTNIGTWDYAIQTSANAQTNDVDITANNQQKNILQAALNIDPASLASATGFVRRYGPGGIPSAGANMGGVAANWHDGSAYGGNTLGNGAVDMQTARNFATQAATGLEATIGGGVNNSAAGNQATIAGGNGGFATTTSASVAGGQFNTANGVGSWIPGGVLANTRARYGIGCAASNNFAVRGDAEQCWSVLDNSGASASAIRLTADGAVANNTANCLNLANNTAFALTIDIVAFDITTVTKSNSWNNLTGLIVRGANAASTALNIASATPAVTYSNGAANGTMSITADTTNGCLNISWTPPGANTDTWHVVASVHSVEVQ